MHSLCTELCSHPVLALIDFIKPFHIESDVSETAVYSVLTREHAFIHKPIALLSKTLTSSKQKYTFHNHELLEIITYCKACCPNIEGQ